MNWPLAERKMKVVHPGRVIGVMYGKEEARKKLSELFPRLEPHLTKPWIITIAELHPIKRLDVLIKATSIVAQRIPNVRLVIIGDGQEKAALTSLVTELGLEDHVFLTGPITEAARFLKAGTVFALASKSESYGYVLHEAGLASVPVVATNVGGIPDIITSPLDGLLVPTNNIDALADALTQTLQNPDQALERVEKLEQKMHSRTTARMVNATTALYELPLN